MIATLQWMRFGDVTMYPAWFALATYMSLYWPLFVAVSRFALHRLRLPLLVAVPVVWGGLEFVRAHLMTGFAWYYLGHTQYRWIELIQICDLVGVYGVGFLLAMASACLAGLAPPALFERLKLVPACRSSRKPDSHATAAGVAAFRRPAVQVGVLLMLVAAALGYGSIRRSPANFVAGPRIALIQGNFTTSVKHDPNESGRMFRTHQTLTGMAVRHQPDVVVWPETMFRWPLMANPEELSNDQLQQAAPQVPVEHWRNERVRDTLADMSAMAGAAMVIGVDTFEARPDGFRRFNSAVFVDPALGVTGRYDKRHRVPFGEYIPLREYFPWLTTLTPFPPDFGIDAGTQPVLFTQGSWRLAPIICFEDTVPHLVHTLVASANATDRPVDCLVNLTNDGWFHGSSELDQHLITSLFRCVECRVPMVRAVNTGISAVIDGDGVVREPDTFIDGDRDPAEERPPRESMRDPSTGRWYKQLNAAIVDTIPLDQRSSLYVKYGDWFAGICGLATVCLALVGAAVSLRDLLRKRS